MADEKTREFPEPDPDEGFLYVREMEDHKLVEEYHFVAALLEAMAGEIDYRLTDGSHRSMLSAEDLPHDPEELDHLLVDLDHVNASDYQR